MNREVIAHTERYRIIKQPLGLYKANCYAIIYKDVEGEKAVVIDPGLHAKQVIDMVGNAKVMAILLTHGHCDHVCAVDGVYAMTKAPVYMHAGDEELLHAKRRMPSSYKGMFTAPFITISESVLDVGGLSFYVYEMPGHSRGSVMFQLEGYLFTGDTLFKDSVGTTQNYNGDEQSLIQTLQRLSLWNPSLIILPGHAEITTLGRELLCNEKLKSYINTPDTGRVNLKKD